MAARLNLTLRQIPWSLLAKASALVLVWFFAPFLVFFLLALYCYFFPSYQSGRLFFPFVFIITLAFLMPISIWCAVVLGGFFVLLFGIKDLFFIDRPFVHEMLVFALLFFLFFGFFSRVMSWEGVSPIFSAMGMAMCFSLLLGGVISYYDVAPETKGEDYLGMPSASRRHRALLGISIAFLMMWELTLVLLFVPLNRYEATALAVLFSATLVELFQDYFRRRFVRQRVLFAASVLFAAMVLILATTEWGL
jgi:hypothetical protein